MSKDVFNYL